MYLLTLEWPHSTYIRRPAVSGPRRGLEQITGIIATTRRHHHHHFTYSICIRVRTLCLQRRPSQMYPKVQQQQERVQMSLLKVSDSADPPLHCVRRRKSENKAGINQSHLVFLVRHLIYERWPQVLLCSSIVLCAAFIFQLFYVWIDTGPEFVYEWGMYHVRPMRQTKPSAGKHWVLMFGLVRVVAGLARRLSTKLTLVSSKKPHVNEDVITITITFTASGRWPSTWTKVSYVLPSRQSVTHNELKIR